MDEKIKEYLIITGYKPDYVRKLDGNRLKRELFKQAINASLNVANRADNEKQLLALTELLRGV